MNLLERYLFTGVVILLSAAAAHSQSRERHPSEYYAGMAEAGDIETARLRAYQNLVQQIQVFVSSTLRRTLTENGTSVSDSSSATTVAMSLLTLRDVEEETEMLDDGCYRVRKFVPRERVREFFDGRRTRIIEHLTAAHNAFQPASMPVDVSAALKNLYAASLELSMYPGTIDSAFTLFDARRYGVSHTGISGAIDAIASAVRFVPFRRIEDDYLVWKYRVLLNDRPVSRLRMNYYDGIGQTDVDVADGQALLTFYFDANAAKDRTVAANVEYRFEEDLDPSLRIADSLRYNPSYQPSFTVTVPGKNTSEIATAPAVKPDERERTVMLASADANDAGGEAPKTIPAAIRSLAAVKSDFNALVQTLDSLQRRHAIVAGNAGAFESLEGLYAIVVAKGEDALLLHQEKGAWISFETGAPVHPEQCAGKRIIWIEVLQ